MFHRQRRLINPLERRWSQEAEPMRRALWPPPQLERTCLSASDRLFLKSSNICSFGNDFLFCVWPS